MTLRVNSLGVNTQSNSDSAATLISNRALVDLNETGIVTSGGSVTRWNNSANRNQSCYFNGTNAYVSTPDSGALALTGDVQTWTWYGVQATDWTTGAFQALSAQWDTTTTNKNWRVYIDGSPDGYIAIDTSTNGTVALTTQNSSVSPAFVDGSSYDISVTYDGTNFRIYTCLAGGTLTQLGAALPLAWVPNTSSVVPLTVGAGYSAGVATQFFNGTIQRFTLHDDSRLAASWDARLQDDYNSSTLTSGGVVWTSTNAIYRDPYDLDVVLGTGANLIKHESGAAAFTGVSGSYISTPDSPAASVVGSHIGLAFINPVDPTPSTLNTIFSKWGATKSYRFGLDNVVTGELEFRATSDGSTVVTKASGVVPSPTSADGSYWAIYEYDASAGSIQFKVNYSSPATTDDATVLAGATTLGIPQSGLPTSIFDSTEDFEVGRAGTALNPFNGQIHRAGIINGILPQGLEFDEDILPAGDWTAYYGGAVAGNGTVTMTVTEDGVDGNSARIVKAVPTVVGCEYVLAAYLVGKSGSVKLAAGNNSDGSSTHTISGAITSLGVSTLSFTATATTTYVGLQVNALTVGAYATWDDTLSSVTPTAAIAVDFNPSLAGRSANGVDGDTFFGAEMLTPSARVINASDWAESGTGSITDNGDGTVTVDDQDVDNIEYRVIGQSITIASAVATFRSTVRLSRGTTANTRFVTQTQGGTGQSTYLLIDWTDPMSATGADSITAHSDGSYTFVSSVDAIVGNTSVRLIMYPAGTSAGVTGSVIVHGEVSLQSQWTMAGGTAIQNSGTAEVRSWGAAGIETTVAPAANIPTPMTMFMAGKADVLGTGAFFTARDDASAGPYVALVGSKSRFDAGGTFIERPIDTSPHLHTARHNGDATTSYQVDSGTPIVGNAGAEEMQFGTLFTSASGTSSYLTGSIGRYILFDRALTDEETTKVQQYLIGSALDGKTFSSVIKNTDTAIPNIIADIEAGTLAAETGALGDLKKATFTLLGYSGSIQDMEEQYLVDLGYTGGLADMQKQYWADYS